MTPEVERVFARVKDQHGSHSLSRVEAMLAAEGSPRHPLQAGARWVLPGISRQPWHDPYGHQELLPLVEELENAHGEIRSELTAAWECRAEAFSDYRHYLGTQRGWRALYLYRAGGLDPSVEALVPTAYRVVERSAVDTGLLCPLLESHFSTLLPGAEVAPHCDLWNFSINLHLAVDVPEGCDLTVAGETREWEEGRCLLFDYSFTHSARNAGPGTRTCLLVDLWHPETTAPEREALTVLIHEVRALFGEG